jgi:hypothetical protein
MNLLFHFMLVLAAGISPAPLMAASTGTIFALKPAVTLVFHSVHCLPST